MTIIQSINLLPHAISNPNIQEQISGDISHELRTPLTVIQVALDILGSGKLGNLSQQELRMIDIATSNVERLMRLTNAIEQQPEAQTTFLSGEQIAQLRLERDLKMALIRNELTLCYQPIVSLQRYQILGFEALLRWQHPTLGMIPPEQFIPLAEKSNLICDLGLWVLQTACHQLRTWQEQFPDDYDRLTISVNVASKQLANPDLVVQVEQILQTIGLKSSNLVLEITESAMMENAVTAKRTLEKLQSLGVRVYIDDFGTGYSSLSRLYELPLNVLKIDRSFVQKLDSPSGKQIVQAIANLANDLGLEVIAEGVETVEQFLKLQLLGCHQGQGYFFAKPLGIYAATELLNSSKSD
ncbi:EAL domain-containing protein [Sphaerospermopsis aphanizomenoides BCCUSP55]|uniref:putative bifunctional diguanylate cyclase/phosphodiesterase n=1 Tax=Sphaerospermopsis aphanizomenoides TaxID=459663 RepID=UPI000ADCB7E7|nr:EAL domain-containing protein [Sphaerospermopsis aphanizomenoides]MBK1990028.1 EAL domain-containing protein [Sphaerospermopsis aphanizomenoides BCCUSP55]